MSLAVQQALLERLQRRSPSALDGDLATFVGQRSVPGRGLGSHPLLGAGTAPFGPPPLAVHEVPVAEVARLAGAVLLDLLQTHHTSPVSGLPAWPSRGRRAWRRAVVLRRDDHAAAQAWQSAVLGGHPRPWGAFAASWTPQPWARQVADAGRRPKLHLGTDEGLLSLAVLDAVRLQGPYLALRYEPSDRAEVRRRLAWAMADLPGRSPGLPPRAHRRLGRDRAQRGADLRELVAQRRYAVDGELGELLKARTGRAKASTPRLLAAYLTGIERVWKER